MRPVIELSEMRIPLYLVMHITKIIYFNGNGDANGVVVSYMLL